MEELAKELERLQGTCKEDEFKSITVKSDYRADSITLTRKTDVKSIVAKLQKATNFTKIKYVKEYGKTQVIIRVE